MKEYDENNEFSIWSRMRNCGTETIVIKRSPEKARGEWEYVKHTVIRLMRAFYISKETAATLASIFAKETFEKHAKWYEENGCIRSPAHCKAKYHICGN